MNIVYLDFLGTVEIPDILMDVIEQHKKSIWNKLSNNKSEIMNCEHVWAPDHLSMMYFCKRCGFQVTEQLLSDLNITMSEIGIWS